MSPASALAQTAQTAQAARPFQGVFGGSGVDPTIRHSLDVTAWVYESYDDNALGDPGGGPVPPSSLVQESAFFTGLEGGLSYSWQGKRVHVAANAGTTGRFYQESGEYLGLSHFGGLGVSADFARRTQLFINQSVSYSPSYFYGLFPDVAAPAVGDVVGTGDPLSSEQVYVYDTAARLSHGISRRGTLEARANLRYSDFSGGQTLTKDLRSYEIGGSYRHGLTRNMTLRLAYDYRKGDYGFTALDRPIVVHDVDAGIDYRRSLSLSRRTSIDFGTGSAIVNTPATDTEKSKLAFRLIGDVGLNQEAGRTWRIRVAYNRGVGFTEGFPQPVFSDAVNSSVTGFFTRRIDFRAYAAFSLVIVGVSSSANRYQAYEASARVRMALGRLWALFGEYSFYNHDLGEIVLTSTPLPNQLTRNSVSGGLTLWFPLLRR